MSVLTTGSICQAALPNDVFACLIERFACPGRGVAVLDADGAIVVSTYAEALLTQAVETNAAAITAGARECVDVSCVSWPASRVRTCAFIHRERGSVHCVIVLVCHDSVAEQTLAHEAQLMRLTLGDLMRMHTSTQEIDSLSTQLSNTYEELSLIYRLSSGMKVNRETREFFRQACMDVMNVVNVRGMGVVLRTTNETPLASLYGELTLPSNVLAPLATELMKQLDAKRQALLINDMTARPDFAFVSTRARQLLAVPLERDGELLGVLFCVDKAGADFDTVDAKLLASIANEAAIYLENAKLFQDVRELLMGLMHSLVSAVDAKDAYTCGHSERVALIARELATVAGLPTQIVERVYMSGLLHDVGKIGVPEAVLQKPGKLNDEEFALMKQHPDIGARILRDVRQLGDIIPGVLHHHERWDGSGYPANLQGNDIPILGRLICLADCFDAMTSNRTYRRALPFEVAMLEIRKNAGLQFDPELAEAFIRIGEVRLRELTSGHHEQASRLIAEHRSLRVA